MSLRAPFVRRRWYERIGAIPTGNKPAVVMLSAVRCLDPPIVVDYLPGGLDQLVVRLGSEKPLVLEEFVEDLDAVGLKVAWMPVRSVDPALERLRQPERWARGLGELAMATPGTGPSLEVVLARMGHAAASAMPPSAASQRTHAALAEAYRRLTGETAPF